MPSLEGCSRVSDPPQASGSRAASWGVSPVAGSVWCAGELGSLTALHDVAERCLVAFLLPGFGKPPKRTDARAGIDVDAPTGAAYIRNTAQEMASGEWPVIDEAARNAAGAALVRRIRQHITTLRQALLRKNLRTRALSSVLRHFTRGHSYHGATGLGPPTVSRVAGSSRIVRGPDATFAGPVLSACGGVHR